MIYKYKINTNHIFTFYLPPFLQWHRLPNLFIIQRKETKSLNFYSFNKCMIFQKFSFAPHTISMSRVLVIMLCLLACIRSNHHFSQLKRRFIFFVLWFLQLYEVPSVINRPYVSGIPL